jgi:superoxide reductase
MNNRRNFLKKSAIAASGLLIARPVLAANSKMMKFQSFPGVIYTEKDPGRWKALTKLHVPIITVKGNQVTIFTNHPMTKPHYIVKHTLVDEKGVVLGDKTFMPTDPKAISTHTLPRGFHGILYATSFCNLHDFWLKEFSV